MIHRLVPNQFVIFLSFTVLLMTMFLFQTTIWFSFLGEIPSPNLWMPIFVYLMMNREGSKRLLWFGAVYLLFLTCSVAMPLQTFTSLSGTFFIIYFIQSRFSTLSIFDLVLFSSGAILTFPLLYSLISYLTISVFHFDLLYHLGSLLLSFPIIPVVLMFCRKIDKVFNPYSSVNTLVLEL